MGHPLSMDLRVLPLAAIDEALSCRAAAARFGVAPSTAIRWVSRRRETSVKLIARGMIGSEATATATNMIRSHDRCRKGERLRMGFPHWFETDVTQRLIPELRIGDVPEPSSGQARHGQPVEP